MPACADLRHERFARELVEQLLRVPPAKQPQLEAYRLAGFAPHRGNCYRLTRRPDVAARIDELMAEAREYLDLRIIKALVKVGRVADALVPAYYEAVADGTLRVRDPTALPAMMQDAIADIELDQDGRPLRVKLHDKMTALAILLKHFGGLPDETSPKTEVNIYNALTSLTVEDQRALASALEALGHGEAAAGAGPAAASGRDGQAA